MHCCRNILIMVALQVPMQTFNKCLFCFWYIFAPTMIMSLKPKSGLFYFYFFPLFTKSSGHRWNLQLSLQCSLHLWQFSPQTFFFTQRHLTRKTGDIHKVQGVIDPPTERAALGAFTQFSAKSRFSEKAKMFYLIFNHLTHPQPALYLHQCTASSILDIHCKLLVPLWVTETEI